MTCIRNFSENIEGRDFVVGDLHGTYSLLEQALAAVFFDPKKDRVFSVGDLVDRGPDSPRCVEFLRQSWFFAVRGNHEDSFLKIVREDGTFDPAESGRITNGLGWIFTQPPEILASIRKEFEKLPLAMEVETPRGTVGFVHAGVPAGMNWETFKQCLNEGNQDAVQFALWDRTRLIKGDKTGVDGIGRVFFGHTPQKDGVKNLGNCYYVDTGAVFRLLNGNTQYCLTLSDIMAETRVLTSSFTKAREEEKIVIVTQVPKQKKTPFGRHSRPPGQ